ncbi:MAG: chloride channel protein [Acidimicrobiia bacterium]|nr:chloride channel protein [Acidimicrobiia bacterium]
MSNDYAFARSKEFWTRIGYSLGIGLTMGVIALAFLQAIDKVIDAIWGDDIDAEFFGGEWWWILLMGGLGLLVGVLRRAFNTREEVPALFEEASERRVDWRKVPGDVTIAFVSLIGGMSLGPEGPLGSMGGGLGTWISEKRNLSDEQREANAVSGMSGGFGGLFTAPFLSTMLVSEAGAIVPGAYTSLVIPSILAATMGFLVVFVVGGQVFLGIYEVAPFEVEVWDFVIAVPLGILGAVLAAAIGMTLMLSKKVTAPLVRFPVGRSVIGGFVLGLIAFAFPLTLFSGSAQLAVSIDDAETLGAGFLLAIVLAKIVALALSISTGFIGGVIFPMIFIGGTTGAALHQIFTDLPEGLAISCLFVAVPAASARIPFTMLVIAAISLTLASPAAGAPAGLAGVVSYILVSGLRNAKQESTLPAEDVD